MKGRQSLLTVNHLHGGYLTPKRLDLVEYYGTEKVTPDGAAIARTPLRNVFGLCKYIMPERLPLPLLSPDVRPLEERDHIATLFLKYLEDTQGGGLHLGRGSGDNERSLASLS